MEKIKKFGQPLPFIVRNKIVQLIEEGAFTPSNRIPSEVKLAEILGVSRVTVREGLRLLEEDGLIIRRQGVGTFTKDYQSLKGNPLEIDLSVTEVIELAGFKAGTSSFKLQKTSADKLIAKKLSIKAGSPVFIIERVRTADERPVVYTIDVFSKDIVRGSFKKFSGSLSKLLRERHDQKIEYSKAEIIPILVKPYIAKKLEIKTNVPLLLIEEIDYSIQDHPILYCREYWAAELFSFTIFRRHHSN